MKLKEFIKDVDLFSESIQFNAMKKRSKQRTLQGALLTISIFLLTFIYFIYQSYLYFSGKMDPKFRQQSFVSDNINIELNNEMFGFDYMSVYQAQKFLSQRQESENKTYMVFVGRYIFNDGKTNQIIPLDIIKCKSPELLGYYCFDLSKIPNPSLVLANDHTMFSYLNLFVYKCRDVDQFKKFVPNNCADEQKINNFINYEPYRLVLKTQVAQYNITSQKLEYQYKVQTFINLLTSTQNNELKFQNQVTKVEQGFVVQQEEAFSTLFSQSLISQLFDRRIVQQTLGYQFLNQIIFEADENVTYFTIQYPIFAEVLALCNSTLALLLVSGTLCRKLAQNLIRRNIFFILMKGFFSQSYLNILQINKIVSFPNQNQEMQALRDDANQEEQSKDNEESKKQVILPYQISKVSQKVSKKNKLNNYQISEQNQQREDSQAIGKQSDHNTDIFKNKENITQNQEVQQEIQKDFQTLKNEKQKNENNSSNEIEIEIEKQGSPSIFDSNQQQQQQFKGGNLNLELVKGFLDTPKNMLLKSANQSNQVEVLEETSCAHMNESFQALKDKSIQQQLEKQLFKFRLFNRKEFLESKGLKKEIIDQVEQQIDESLDFFTFYKELLLLKKAIMILLSKEQFAALQVIGINIEKIKKNQENGVVYDKSEEKFENHFKSQFEILQSKELQNQYISSFIKRCCQSRLNLDEIDERILSSLLISQQN